MRRLAADFRAFVQAVFADWVGRMSGGLGVLVMVVEAVAAWRALPIPGGRVVLVAGIVALLVAVFRAWRVERQRSVGVQSERWDSVVARLASLSDDERAAVRRVVVTGTDRDPCLERVARETQLVQRHYVGGHYEVAPAVAAELQRWATETPPGGQDRSG